MIKRSLLVTLIFFVLSFELFSQGVHHELNVLLTPQNSSISLRDSIRFSSGFLNEPKSLIFYLNPNLKVKLLDGNFTLKQSDKQDILPLATRYELIPQKGETDYVVLQCTGQINDSLTSGAAEYARGFSETKGLISSTGVYLSGSSYWMPSFDVPLFTYRLTTLLPAKWLVVSQGVRTINDTANGLRTVCYNCKDPQDQAYLTAAKWTEYDQLAGNVRVQAFLRTPDEKLANRYIKMTGVYLKMYVKLLGEYPYGKFALVENFWETGYGMPSFTLLGPRIIRFPFILYSSYPHELLHNWWGNSVYVAMEQGNWCEGLTAYMADHMLKEQRGQGAAYRRSTLQKFTDFVNPDNDFPVVDFRERHNAAEEAIGYGKSLMFQHMLRKKFGDSLYIQAYRKFYKDYRFKIASFDDIRHTFEQLTGSDLKPFFDEWLTRIGAPQLSLTDVRLQKKHKRYQLSFSLSQVQKEGFFPMDVPVAVYFEDTVRVIKTNMAQRKNHVEMVFNRPPIQMFVDPGFDVFRRLDKGEVPPSLTQLFGSIQGTIVLPHAGKNLHAYRQLALIWKKMQEAQGKSLSIVMDNTLDKIPVEGAVWVLGFENKFAGQFSVEKQFNSYFSSKQIATLERLRKEGSLVFAIPNGSNRAQTIGFVGANGAKALSGLARLLPHYGKYSYLGFEGLRPDNVLKGTFPPLHSPLQHHFTSSKKPASLPAEKALISMQ